ncbi:MAG: DNA-binding protein [Nitratireductor sp.]
MDDSRNQVAQMMNAQGVSVKEWAEARGFNPRTVYAVIHGRLKCKRGISHRIAVELGIKAKPQKIAA